MNSDLTYSKAEITTLCNTMPENLTQLGRFKPSIEHSPGSEEFLSQNFGKSVKGFLGYDWAY